MSAGELVLAVAATVVAGILGMDSARRLTKESGRTAARLIYAELTRNAAPVAYFLRTALWPTFTVETAVWGQRAEAVARLRKAEAFTDISRGYAALEAISYLAAHEGWDDDARASALSQLVRELEGAIRSAAAKARIPVAVAEAAVHDLIVAPSPDVPAPAVPTRSDWVPSMIGMVSYDLFINARSRGTPDQQRIAERSLERLSAQAPATDHPEPVAPPTLNRAVYDAQGLEQVTGKLARSEGQPPVGDPAVDEVYDAMGATHAFFLDAFDHDLQQDTGTPMVAVVHYGRDFDNVFWDGTRFVAGDGDGVLFQRFTAAPDVTAHELAHALVQRAGLNFSGQAGALVESLCDVFGVLADQHRRHQLADDDDWLVGAGVFGPSVQAPALRSMSAPGTLYDDPVLGEDPQVGHMDDYRAGGADVVHIDSGIPSRAFYLVATDLGGFAWERAGRIWYDALVSGRLRPTSGFAAFARITLEVARERFGDESPEVAAVRNAWTAVGVRPGRRRPAAT